MKFDFSYFSIEECSELLLSQNRNHANNPDRYYSQLSEWKTFATYEIEDGEISSSDDLRSTS